MASQRITFENEAGIRLSGIVDTAEGTPLAYAIFTHCFTCTKDLKAIVKISRQLAKRSIAVFRFDFTGLGHSGGRFENSNFETNLADLRAAVDWLSATHEAPQLLIGHSLGGAAAMASVGEFKSVKALVTLAAPSCTKHLAKHLIMHSPADETVAFSCAQELFEWTSGAKTLFGLPGSDHLFVNQKQDANWVADCVAVWARRFFE